MSQRKIKLLCDLSGQKNGIPFFWPAGYEVVTDAGEAKALIRAGHAEYVKDNPQGNPK